MIDQEMQLRLFSEIAEKLETPLACYAFGGTAMMFLGFKAETKDIDLLFLRREERELFIEAIKSLGFVVTSPVHVYIKKKEAVLRAPVMFQRGDVRFDLFAETVFRSGLSPGMIDRVVAEHLFGARKNFCVSVLSAEHVAYLKGITERDRDFADIKVLAGTDASFDWSLVVDEALWQHANGDDWALLDTEKTLQEMRVFLDVPPELLQRLYDAQD